MDELVDILSSFFINYVLLKTKYLKKARPRSNIRVCCVLSLLARGGPAGFR